MEPATTFAIFLKALAFILFGYYLIPAGSMYVLFYVLKWERWKTLRIQNRYPEKGAIRREIKWSLLSVVIGAIMATIMILFMRAGKTKMYFDIHDYGWMYFVFSIVLFIMAYDTFFYWVHRFMHLKKVFPIVHRIHHLSATPTPWAILAFHPLETILEFLIYPLVIFVLPLHPAALFIFIVYNIILNTGGHLGFEITPKSFFRHPLLKFGLTVTHHELHHSKAKCNYGIYFIFWDRIMGTNHPDYEETFLKTKDKSPAA